MKKSVDILKPIDYTKFRKSKQSEVNTLNVKPYYPYLEAEISKRGIKKKQIAEQLGISERAFSCKMTGKNDFWLEEALAIYSLFSDISFTNLFAHK